MTFALLRCFLFGGWRDFQTIEKIGKTTKRSAQLSKRSNRRDPPNVAITIRGTGRKGNQSCPKEGIHNISLSNFTRIFTKITVLGMCVTLQKSVLFSSSFGESPEPIKDDLFLNACFGRLILWANFYLQFYKLSDCFSSPPFSRLRGKGGSRQNNLANGLGGLLQTI